jgi:hypothetical protein
MVKLAEKIYLSKYLNRLEHAFIHASVSGRTRAVWFYPQCHFPPASFPLDSWPNLRYTEYCRQGTDSL